MQEHLSAPGSDGLAAFFAIQAGHFKAGRLDPPTPVFSLEPSNEERLQKPNQSVDTRLVIRFEEGASTLQVDMHGVGKVPGRLPTLFQTFVPDREYQFFDLCMVNVTFLKADQRHNCFPDIKIQCQIFGIRYAK